MDTVTTGPAPDLGAYDIVLVNSSAGKDSQASLDVVVEHARAANALAKIVVVHADLGDAEWGDFSGRFQRPEKSPDRDLSSFGGYSGWCLLR